MTVPVRSGADSLAESLPVEVWCLIESFLSVRDLLECGRVCRHLRHASLQLFPGAPPPLPPCSCGTSRGADAERAEKLQHRHRCAKTRAKPRAPRCGSRPAHTDVGGGRHYFTQPWVRTNHVELCPPGEVLCCGYMSRQRKLMVLVSSASDGVAEEPECYAYMKWVPPLAYERQQEAKTRKDGSGTLSPPSSPHVKRPLSCTDFFGVDEEDEEEKATLRSIAMESLDSEPKHSAGVQRGVPCGCSLCHQRQGSRNPEGTVEKEREDREGEADCLDEDECLFLLEATTGLPFTSRVELPMVFADPGSHVEFQGSRYLVCTCRDGELLLLDAVQESLVELPLDIHTFHSSPSGNRFVVEDAGHFYYCNAAEQLVPHSHFPSRRSWFRSRPHSSNDVMSSHSISSWSSDYEQAASWSREPARGLHAPESRTLQPQQSVSAPGAGVSLSLAPLRVSRESSFASSDAPSLEVRVGSSAREASWSRTTSCSRTALSATSAVEGSVAAPTEAMEPLPPRPPPPSSTAHWWPAPFHYHLLEEPLEMRTAPQQDTPGLTAAQPQTVAGEGVRGGENAQEGMETGRSRRFLSRSSASVSDYTDEAEESLSRCAELVMEWKLCLETIPPLAIGAIGDSSAAWHQFWVGERSFLYENEGGLEFFYEVPLTAAGSGLREGSENHKEEEGTHCRTLECRPGVVVVREQLNWKPGCHLKPVCFRTSLSATRRKRSCVAEEGTATSTGDGDPSDHLVLTAAQVPLGTKAHGLLGLQRKEVAVVGCGATATAPLYANKDEEEMQYDAGWRASRGSTRGAESEDMASDRKAAPYFLSHSTVSSVAHAAVCWSGTRSNTMCGAVLGDACSCDEYVFLDAQASVLHVVQCAFPACAGSSRLEALRVARSFATRESATATARSRGVWSHSSGCSAVQFYRPHGIVLQCRSHFLQTVLPPRTKVLGVQIVTPETFRPQYPVALWDSSSSLHSSTGMSGGRGDGVWLLHLHHEGRGQNSCAASHVSQHSFLFLSSDLSARRPLGVVDHLVWQPGEGGEPRPPLLLQDRGCLLFPEASTGAYYYQDEGGAAAQLELPPRTSAGVSHSLGHHRLTATLQHFPTSAALPRRVVGSSSGCNALHGQAITSGYGFVIRFPFIVPAGSSSMKDVGGGDCRTLSRLPHPSQQASSWHCSAAEPKHPPPPRCPRVQQGDDPCGTGRQGRKVKGDTSRSWRDAVCRLLCRSVAVLRPNPYTVVTMLSLVSCYMVATSLVWTLLELLWGLWSVLGMGGAFLYPPLSLQPSQSVRSASPACGVIPASSFSVFSFFSLSYSPSIVFQPPHNHSLTLPLTPNFVEGTATALGRCRAAGDATEGEGVTAVWGGYTVSQLIYRVAILSSALYITHYTL